MGTDPDTDGLLSNCRSVGVVDLSRFAVLGRQIWNRDRCTWRSQPGTSEHGASVVVPVFCFGSCPIRHWVSQVKALLTKTRVTRFCRFCPYSVIIAGRNWQNILNIFEYKIHVKSIQIIYIYRIIINVLSIYIILNSDMTRFYKHVWAPKQGSCLDSVDTLATQSFVLGLGNFNRFFVNWPPVPHIV